MCSLVWKRYLYEIIGYTDIFFVIESGLEAHFFCIDLNEQQHMYLVV